ncbi:MAG TPA: HAD family hydrolase [Candidatus Eisenbacteria bacterium]|jgi:putative hydrolase of the HAD superfamily
MKGSGASRSGQDASRLAAVVFDAGGTLVRLDYEWMALAITQMGHPMDAARLRRGEIEGRRRYDSSRGIGDAALPQPLGANGDIRAYLGGMLAAAGLPHYLIGPVIVRLLARDRTSGLWARPMEGARQALDAVAEMGLRCAVISNSDGRAEATLERCEMTRGVEFVLDSHLVGVEKPDPGIFRMALERLAVAPERALFVGDIRSVDEAGARVAKMPFVLIDPYGDYAAPGTAAIAGLESLAAFVASSYAVPRMVAGSGR